jgi:hypothetical protein
MGDVEELLNGGEEDPTSLSILQVREVAARSLPPTPVES